MSHTCHLVSVSLLCTWFWILPLWNNSNNSQQSSPLDIIIIIQRRSQNFWQLKHWSNCRDSAANKTAFLSRQRVPTVPTITMSQTSWNHRLWCFCNCMFNWHSFWKQPEQNCIWPIKTTSTPCRLFRKRNIDNVPKIQMHREIQWYSYKRFNLIWWPSQMGNISPLSTPEKRTCKHHFNWNNKQIFFTNE